MSTDKLRKDTFDPRIVLNGQGASTDKPRKDASDPRIVLNGQGAGQSRLRFAPDQIIYAQGDPADALFYIESGWVKASVVTPSGKEAVIALRGEGEFVGTRSLVRQQRMGATVALTACSLVRITTPALMQMLRGQPGFAEMFAVYLVRQSVRDQGTLVDQLINSAEKRLARTLLRLADFGQGNDPGPIPTRLNQTVLAKMVGTTRSRVNFFMNKFKRQGLIEYNRHGYVSVRNALRDMLPDA